MFSKGIKYSAGRRGQQERLGLSTYFQLKWKPNTPRIKLPEKRAVVKHGLEADEKLSVGLGLGLGLGLELGLGLGEGLKGGQSSHA